MPTELDPDRLKSAVLSALDEDLPDITSEAIFEPSDRGRAHFLVKASGIIAGHPFAEETFAVLDASSRYSVLIADGSPVEPGAVVATVESSVIALLSGERTALNFMQRASGIATTTRRYVDAVKTTGARIVDTRKTAPGLRMLDKYAVVCGGGENHRYGLHDMFLVKNNHVDRAGSLAAAVQRIRDQAMPQKIMVEVRNLQELEEALLFRPDFVMLDNMSPEEMQQAVARAGSLVELEASGGITLETIGEVAATGVHRISIGALTHSVRALDISLRIEG